MRKRLPNLDIYRADWSHSCPWSMIVRGRVEVAVKSWSSEKSAFRHRLPCHYKSWTRAKHVYTASTIATALPLSMARRSLRLLFVTEA